MTTLGNIPPLPATALPPHVLSTVIIKNLTSRRVPVGGGIILMGGQTLTKQVPFVQVQEELVPRLALLQAKAIVSFKIIAGEPSDIAGTPGTLTSGRTGAVTAPGTKYLDQKMTEFASDATGVGGWIMTRAGRLRNFFGFASTPSGVGGIVTYTVRIARQGGAPADTKLVIVFPASATVGSASDTADYVDYSPGDRVTIKQVAAAGAILADVRLSIEA